ncbi:MAG: N-6 DNA methylase, partial [Planctomycetaceae bacterium]|nr:N-6 DNA methylase [Planctomycetaceae bacterium]
MDTGKIEGNFAHIFERAAQSCNLKGVYTCREKQSEHTIPVVYICEAEAETEAQEIHKKVWNQNSVPFVIVVSPKVIRVYNGFRFDRNGHKNLLENIQWNEIQTKLKSLSRESIDNGEIWHSELWKKGPANQSKRLDVQLLKNLNDLGNELKSEKLDLETAHGLIGKYVYLRYLRDRQILSDKRLENWRIEPDKIFTDKAQIKSFKKLNDILQEKLNGSIFPLQNENKSKHIRFDEKHLQLVAGTFFGNNPSQGQRALFDLYDFAFIPTELLSVIYEQFLHQNDKDKNDQGKDQNDRGKDKGAYYTPLPLVNFVLNELEEKKPLTEKMRILDPSCGSGAFLVQTYRNLIRKALQKSRKKELTPQELKNLLTEHIFGIDIDRDACRVTQLGLLLTLLDNLKPSYPFSDGRFLLPKLDNNIIESDTFDMTNEILQQFKDKKFDWIVGNPPWKKLDQESLAGEWIKTNKKEHPVSNSIAEAFLWRSLDFADDNTVIGLLMPAMSLFNKRNQKGDFRQSFFSRCGVWTIANFANLRQHLFANAKASCAAFFFRPEKKTESDILTYCPLRINQAINRNNVWNIIVNSSEIKYVSNIEAATGDPLVWKTAIWGSHRDLNLLKKIACGFESFEEFAKKQNIKVHEGPQLRTINSSEPVEYLPELCGQYTINVKELKNTRHVFIFPKDAFEVINKEFCYLRKRDGNKCLEICRPPHIFIDDARRVVIYSDDFFVIPPRQIGISGEDNNRLLMKAIALYLSSNFVRYHQFFLATQWGIDRKIAILDTLKKLPVPFIKMSEKDIKEWSDIYEQLQNNAKSKQFSQEKQDSLLFNANKRINKILGLRDSEQLLIIDFLKYKMNLIDGGIDNNLITCCDKYLLTNYAGQLKKSLDSFFDKEDNIHHDVTVLSTNNESMAG